MFPIMQVCTHSYKRDIAGVVDIRSVMGGCNFFMSLGSYGASIPNWTIVSNPIHYYQSQVATHQFDNLY